MLGITDRAWSIGQLVDAALSMAPALPNETPPEIAETDQGDGKEFDDPPPTVEVGDYVQWTSNGVDQFKPVRKVTQVENGHVWVFGSNTALPMEQITVTDPPVPKSVIVEPSDRDNGPPDDLPQIDVLLRGNRLQITADVDAARLQTLKEMIGKYEEILKLVVHHSDFDVLIPSHSRIGKLSGGTRISMLLGTPG